jgi:hypothetical protein
MFYKLYIKDCIEHIKNDTTISTLRKVRIVKKWGCRTSLEINIFKKGLGGVNKLFRNIVLDFEKYRTKPKPRMGRTKGPRILLDSQPLVEDANGFNSDVMQENLDSGMYDERNRRTGETGQPRKFRTKFMREVYFLAKLGARDVDICEFFNIDSRTLSNWKTHRPEMNQAIFQGKWMFSFKIAEVLGKRALGYDYTETEYSEHVTKYGQIVPTKKVTHKHMPPDVTAIMFYLKNRHRDLWADVNRQEIDASLTINQAEKMDLSGFDDAEKGVLRKYAIQKLKLTNGNSE